MSRLHLVASLLLAPVLLLSLACSDDGGGAPGGSSAGGSGLGGSGHGGSGGLEGVGGAGGLACADDDAGPNETLGSGGDPAGGVFSLDEALEGLPPGDGPLRAIFRTELGDITCTLEDTLVPNAVANFVGLARGRRPWRDPGSGTWVRRRFYDGLIFHRIIDDFMAQGGDPLGTGTGGPGYQFADEITALLHTPGTLAYANSGPDTNGSQFYITEIATGWLDGDYTIFGTCGPMATIEALTATPTDLGDKPLTDVHTLSIDISRCPVP